MDKITPLLPRGCTGGESIYTLARHHWPPSGGNTPLVVGASDEIDTEPLLSARFVIAVQSTVMCLTQTQKLITVTTSTKEMRTPPPKEPITLFWSVQWDRVNGHTIIFADIFMQWLIQFDALMMMRQSCSPLKFVAVGLVKIIYVLVLLLMYKSTENLFIEPLFHFASLFFIKNSIYE